MVWEYTELTVANWDQVERLQLNQLGAADWELVQVLEWGAGNVKYFFKRFLPSTIPNPRDMLGYDDRDGGAMAKPKIPELV